jgi:upstream activation factor subunit UAF30
VVDGKLHVREPSFQLCPEEGKGIRVATFPVCLREPTMGHAGMENRMPKKKTNTAFLKMAQAPLKPSPQLAEVLGSAAPISRPQVAKKVWAYIKKHKLQDPKKRREIVADDKLKPVFGKARLDMFQMTKAISKHLSK